jgi:hypothetical protein
VNNVYLPCLFLPLVLFIAAEKKRRVEEAQQSGPNAAQSNGTVSFFGGLSCHISFFCWFPV